MKGNSYRKAAKKLFFTTVLSASFILNIKTLCAEESEFIEAYKIEPEVNQDLFYAILNNTQLASRNAFVEKYEDSLDKNTWSGSKQYIQLEIVPKIYFEKKSNYAKLSTPLDLEIKDKKSKIILNGNWIRDAVIPGEFRHPSQALKTSISTYRANEMTFIIISPQFKNTQQLYAHLFCINQPPLKLRPQKDEQGFIVKKDLYEGNVIIPTSVKFKGKAFMEGGFNTTFEKDFAFARLLSNDFFKSEAKMSDFILRKSPFVNAVYIPKKNYEKIGNFDLNHIVSSQFTAQLVYHNFLGFKREYSQTLQSWVEKLDELPQNLENYVRRLSYKTTLKGPLGCFIVGKRMSTEIKYSKENFPEK